MSPIAKALCAIVLLAVSLDSPARCETWRELRDRADSLRDEFAYDSAIVTARQALEAAEHTFGPEDTTTADILHLLGLLNYETADYTEAVLLLLQARGLWEKLLGPEHPDVAQTVNTLGNSYKALSQYADAEAAFREAIKIWSSAPEPDHWRRAVGMVNLAYLYSELGEYHKAEPLYKKAAAIFEEKHGPKNPYLAFSLNKLGDLYWEQGRYAEAENQLLQALKIREATLDRRDPFLAVNLNDIAKLYREQGRYSEAESLYTVALIIWKTAYGDRDPRVATAQGNLAIVYSDQGDYIGAESLYLQTLSIDEENLGPNDPDVALDLDNLATDYAAQGKYSKAEPLIRRAIAIWEAVYGSDHPYTASGVCNLANVCTHQGKYEEASSLYQQALMVWENAYGHNHPEKATGLERFSELHRLRDNNDTALEMSCDAFGIRLADFQDNGWVLPERDALTYSKRVRRSADNYFSCFLDASQHVRAMSTEAADIVLQCKGRVSDDVFWRQQLVISEKDSLTLTLARSLRSAKRELSACFLQGPDEDLVGFRQYIDSLNAAIRVAEAKMVRYSASFRRRQEYKEVSVEGIASLLSEKSVLVEYLKYNYLQPKTDSMVSRYLAATINSEGNVNIADLGEASAIDVLISDYREHMLRISSQKHKPLRKDKDEYETIAQKLYEAVVRPLAEHLPEGQQIFIAPDAGLNMLSFAGLIGDNSTYLVERYAVHYLSSGRDLIRLKDRGTCGRGLLAIGDPDFNATIASRLASPTPQVLAAVTADEGFRAVNVRSGCGDLNSLVVERLPEAETEIRTVTQQWTGGGSDSAVIFSGPQASEDRFKSQAPGKRVIHLATHGYFFEGHCNPDVQHRGFDWDQQFIGDNPLLLSGLLFAGANLHGEGADSAGVEDGVLSAYEVSAMNLEGTNLVVLSACETGLGKVEEGEGVYGLRRAFQMAGVRTVVSALWPVSDETTADMMGDLYAQSGKPLPERIRDMQLAKIQELRSQGFADHPYNWAAFIAMGDWK